MKTQIASIFLIISLAFALAIEVQAQDSGQHGHQPDARPGQGQMSNKGGMQQHMREMQQTMQQIQGADNPDDRHQLMQKHRQQMHEAMGSMCGMMADKSMMGDKGHHKGMGDMDPEARRKMMQNHMQMMKGMMEQMEMHMEADKPMQRAQ